LNPPPSESDWSSDSSIIAINPPSENNTRHVTGQSPVAPSKSERKNRQPNELCHSKQIKHDDKPRIVTAEANRSRWSEVDHLIDKSIRTIDGCVGQRRRVTRTFDDNGDEENANTLERKSENMDEYRTYRNIAANMTAIRSNPRRREGCIIPKPRGNLMCPSYSYTGSLRRIIRTDVTVETITATEAPSRKPCAIEL